MSQTPFFQTLRELARCYQAFECFAARDIRQYELTTAQFDIIATLGNTDGFTPKQLSEKTLITKGTLTGVLDRLVKKQLVKRRPSEIDRRSLLVVLTPTGQKIFEQIFPSHINTLQKAFAGFNAADYLAINQALHKLNSAFEHPASHLQPTEVIDDK
jgi:MarR family 2-MHQ and catechol resistance regulon transcriptional repressor